MNESLAEQITFTVTTLNTHYGRAVSLPEATQVLIGSDIVLLQEVHETDQLAMQRNLGCLGLKLTAQNEHAGLAIAVSDRFSPVRGEYFPLQRQGKLVKAAKNLGLEQRLRERGILLATLTDNLNGNRLVAATAHPIVPVRHFARAKQVGTMGKLINSNYATGSFVLGADMNHFPMANKVDRQMAIKGRLKSVSNTDPTYLLKSSRHSWLSHLGVPDLRLDTLLFRSLVELSSDAIHVESDHKAVQATFIFPAR